MSVLHKNLKVVCAHKKPLANQNCFYRKLSKIISFLETYISISIQQSTRNNEWLHDKTNNLLGIVSSDDLGQCRHSNCPCVEMHRSIAIFGVNNID